MAETPISVVVTCFNLRPYIAEAIGSALGQDYKGEVELIVVDDCSTDGSADIIQTFPCRYLKTPSNSGVLAATLLGIEAASHRRIAFLDGDDIWEPAKLRLVAKVFEKEPAITLVTHDLCFVDAKGFPINRVSLPSRRLGPITPKRRSDLIREGILTLGDDVWLGSAMAVDRKRGAVDEFANWARSLPKLRDIYQDWPLAYWIASRPDVRCAYIDEKLFRYRLHGANHSGNSETVSLAIRNLTRVLNTLQAEQQIAVKHNLPCRFQTALAVRVQSVQYLIDLNEGRRGKAISGFVRSIPDFAQRRILMKEVARLVAVQALGPRRFLRMSSKRRFLRQLRVT